MKNLFISSSSMYNETMRYIFAKVVVQMVLKKNGRFYFRVGSDVLRTSPMDAEVAD